MLFFLSVQTYSQVLQDSLTLSNPSGKNKLSSSFEKLLNTSNLNSRLRFSSKISDWNISINENYRSTVISSSTKSITDEHLFLLTSSYAINDFFEPGLALRHSLYLGDRRLTINQTSYLNGIIFAKFSTQQNIFVTPFGGYSTNEQVGEVDDGPLYGIEGIISDLNFNDFYINANAKFQNEDISPRKNILRKINLNTNNYFQKNFQNLLNAEYTLQRKDFYFTADSIVSSEFDIVNNIQGRTEQNYFIEDRFIYDSGSNIRLGLQGRIRERNIERNTRYISMDNINSSTFDSKIEEFRLDFESMMDYRLDSFNSSFKIGYSEREENHSAKPIEGANEIIFQERQRNEERKSNRSQLITLGVSGNFIISDRDNLVLSFFHRKFKYDTPSEENYDDRDELLSTLGIYYSRDLTPFFQLFFNLDGSVNHIAYIFAERSANNNFNRSIKFQSGGTYRGKNLTTRNIAEVSANYTTYDFEEINPNLKSFSFRQFALKDSTVLRIKNNLGFEIIGYIKLSEQGDFNWKNFSGKPVRFLQEIFIEPKMRTIFYQFLLSIGMRYFSLSTYNYSGNNVRQLKSNYTSIGPMTEIKFLIEGKLQLNLYGYYEFIRTIDNLGQERANLFLNIDWNF